ncbi:MAG: septum formation initiator family protein [Deltaproteobacteria bacterium]|nr:septum formation initiator family protein [Deltaproteobacteria bacterium]MBW1945364.1 septum formation initiator family protein [Deltaproteobacteria bacterium]
MAFTKKGFFKFSFFALLFLGLIVSWLGFGERGFIHLYRMEKERQTHLEKIHKLESENKRLLEEIKRLQSDKEHIESTARRELGVIKKNETLYRLIPEKDQKKTTTGAQENKKSNP